MVFAANSHYRRGPVGRRSIYSTGQIAVLCGVAPRTVAKWIDSGRLRGYRIPGSHDRRVAHTVLLGFLRDNGMPVPAVLGEATRLIVASPGLLLPAQLSGCLTGWKVQHAGNLFDAGLLCAGLPPEGVVVDGALGRTAVLQLARTLRTRPDWQAVVYIAVACEDCAGADLEELAEVYDHVLAAPADPARIAALVSGV